MENIQVCINQAEKTCRLQGLILTTKRKLILTALLQVKKAVSAYELVELLETQFKESLAPMSIYRILAFLEKCHLVHKLNIANKYVACADILNEQPHETSQLFFCQLCQRVDEVKLEPSKSSDLDNKAKQFGYQILSSHIELNCMCNACLR
jgi:Fur family zinc uptake transcriptional regulator